MGYYSQNPYEQPEPPRCLSCDEFMEKMGLGISFRWECHNPACEECPPKYQVVECSTCGEEYTYGEFCRNCTDGAYHDLDIQTSTYKELDRIIVLLEKQQAVEHSVHLTGLTPRQKEEVEQIVMRALSTGSV